MPPREGRRAHIDHIVAMQCQQCWKWMDETKLWEGYCHDCWDAWGRDDHAALAAWTRRPGGAWIPPPADAGPKKKAKSQSARPKTWQPKGASSGSAGSGSQSAEPAFVPPPTETCPNGHHMI